MTKRQYLSKAKVIDKKIERLNSAKNKLYVRYIKSNVHVAYRNYKDSVVVGKVATKKKFKSNIENIAVWLD